MLLVCLFIYLLEVVGKRKGGGGGATLIRTVSVSHVAMQVAPEIRIIFQNDMGCPRFVFAIQ